MNTKFEELPPEDRKTLVNELAINDVSHVDNSRPNNGNRENTSAKDENKKQQIQSHIRVNIHLYQSLYPDFPNTEKLNFDKEIERSILENNIRAATFRIKYRALKYRSEKDAEVYFDLAKDKLVGLTNNELDFQAIYEELSENNKRTYMDLSSSSFQEKFKISNFADRFKPIVVKAFFQSTLDDHLLERLTYIMKYLQGKQDIKPDPQRARFFTEIINRYNGACDLICNYFTIIGIGESRPSEIKEKLEIEYINRDDRLDKLAKTHILETVGFISLLIYFFTRKIPNNVFSSDDQRELIEKRNGVDTINQTLLEKKFKELDIGSYIKFSCYEKNFLGLPSGGHSMLICKKDEDEYIFIDPGDRSVKVFRLSGLSSQVKEAYEETGKYIKSSSSGIAFIDNTQYIADLKVRDQMNECDTSRRLT